MSELVVTEDGSLTMFNEETGELYHNKTGAFSEALETYVIPSGAVYKMRERNELRVLDACFGMGYNTFALIEKLIESDACGTLQVVAIELYGETFAATAQVLQIEQLSRVCELFGGNPSLEFGSRRFVRNNFSVQLELLHCDLRNCIPQLQGQFDLVFHDPFTARKVPQLWTVDLFTEYYRLLKPAQGEFLTYSRSRPVRSGLSLSGFLLYQTLAAPRKGGGTLATTSALVAPRPGTRPLSDIELQKLQEMAGVPYRDDNFALPEERIRELRAIEQSAYAQPRD